MLEFRTLTKFVGIYFSKEPFESSCMRTALSVTCLSCYTVMSLLALVLLLWVLDSLGMIHAITQLSPRCRLPLYLLVRVISL